MSSQPKSANEQSIDATDPYIAQQKADTAALLSHSDPHVRIIAHMSERQLAMHYLLTDIRREMRDGFSALNEKVEALSGRQDTLESHYQNGAGHDPRSADAQ